MTMNTTYQATLANKYVPISWGAIFAGFVFAIAITNVLNLIGVSTGFLVVGTDSWDISSLGIGSLIWLLLSSAVATFSGTWLCALTSRHENRLSGIIDGFLIWATTTIATIIMAANLTGFMIGGAANLIHYSMSSASNAYVLTSNSSNKLLSELNSQVYNSLQDSITNDIDKLNLSASDVKNLQNKVYNYLTQTNLGLGNLGNTEELKNNLRSQIVQLMSKNSSYSSDEINSMLNNWINNFNQLKDKAQEKMGSQVKSVSSNIGTLLLYLLFINIISLISALVSGYLFSQMRSPEGSSKSPHVL